MEEENEYYIGDEEGEYLDYEPAPYSWVERAVEKSMIVAKSTGPLSITESYIIDSCLARRDFETAKQHIRDWNDRRERRIQPMDVSKWTPGTHYYALDKKFDDLESAIDYLNSRGYRFSGTVRERFHYRESGG